MGVGTQLIQRHQLVIGSEPQLGDISEARGGGVEMKYGPEQQGKAARGQVELVPLL